MNGRFIPATLAILAMFASDCFCKPILTTVTNDADAFIGTFTVDSSSLGSDFTGPGLPWFAIVTLTNQPNAFSLVIQVSHNPGGPLVGNAAAPFGTAASTFETPFGVSHTVNGVEHRDFFAFTWSGIASSTSLDGLGATATGSGTISAFATPEPGTFILLSLGLCCGLTLMHRLHVVFGRSTRDGISTRD